MREILLALFIDAALSVILYPKGYTIKTRKGKVYLALMKHKTQETNHYGSDYSLTSKIIKGLNLMKYFETEIYCPILFETEMYCPIFFETEMYCPIFSGPVSH